jgi:arylsulfatase A-like enzyme
MPGDTFTVAHLMKKAGYTTGIIGKWGLGKPDSASVPTKMGFDYFFGYNCQLRAHEYYPDHLWRNDEVVPLDGKTYSHDLMANEALEFVRRSKDQPFFLYLAFTIPHQKLQVPDLGPYEKEPWPENLKTIAAMITRLDRDIGRLMALLKELKLDENTLVMFNSDNGAVYRDTTFNHSGPLRGFKRDMYEGGIRSPSIARWPGKVKAGATSEQVWAFWDVMPTLGELVGQKSPADIDGVSVLSGWLGQKIVEHPPMYWEFHEGGFFQAARIGDWKAVRLGTKKPIELYNLKTDGSEKNDVASQQPELVEEIRELSEKRARGLGTLADQRERAAAEGEEGGRLKLFSLGARASRPLPIVAGGTPALPGQSIPQSP